MARKFSCESNRATFSLIFLIKRVFIFVCSELQARYPGGSTHLAHRSRRDAFMEKENLDETAASFVDLATTLIEKSPKIGYAVLLLHMG